jgi:hypothetical protein
MRTVTVSSRIVANAVAAGNEADIFHVKIRLLTSAARMLELVRKKRRRTPKTDSLPASANPNLFSNNVTSIA